MAKNTYPKSNLCSGRFFFIGYFGAVDVGAVRVHRISDGAHIGLLSPPSNLKCADVDKYYGISAFKRSNGEILVLNGDHYYGKQTMFRWCPSGNCQSVTSTADEQENLMEEIVKVYPVPASSQLSLSFIGNAEGEGNISLCNNLSVPVLNKKIKVSKGNNEITVNVNEPQSGLYLLVLQQNGKRVTKKVLIEK